MTHPTYLIAALDSKNGIGKAGVLPWRLKKDLQFFQRITESTTDPTKMNRVIMGRATWESIPENRRPLPGRHNVILTRNCKLFFADGIGCCHSLDAAFKIAHETTEKIFVIGGGQVFQEAILRPEVTGIYLTRVKGDFGCDTFFPSLPSQFKNIQTLGHEEENGAHYDFLLYTKD